MLFVLTILFVHSAGNFFFSELKMSFSNLTFKPKFPKFGGNFKVCGDKLILYILELQIKSKKKDLIETILDILKLQMKKKGLRRQLLF